MWFRRKPKPDPGDAVRGLRDRALQIGAAELGLAPTAARPHVWGVLMETGYPEVAVTLVALADGTASLYFSNGGAVIGAGGHASVHTAADTFLTVTEAHLAEFAPASATPVPGVGRVRFHVRTFGGTLGAEADEQDLGHGHHALSRVFHAGHALIAAIRIATERHQV